MNQSPFQILDSLLNRWAERRAASEAQLQQLRYRILHFADRKPAELVPLADNPRMESDPPHSERGRRALWISCGFAMVIVVILGYVSRLGPPAPKPTPSDGGKAGAAMGADQSLEKPPVETRP